MKLSELLKIIEIKGWKYEINEVSEYEVEIGINHSDWCWTWFTYDPYRKEEDPYVSCRNIYSMRTGKNQKGIMARIRKEWSFADILKKHNEKIAKKEAEARKITLNDDDKTVIEEISTEVDRYADFDETAGRYFYAIAINGIVLKYTGEDPKRSWNRDFKKLIRKGAVMVRKQPYIDEQEQAHWEAVAKDQADPEKHGHIVAMTLAGERSSILVWDYYKQEAVLESELTKVKEVVYYSTSFVQNLKAKIPDPGDKCEAYYIWLIKEYLIRKGADPANVNCMHIRSSVMLNEVPKKYAKKETINITLL